MSATAQTHFTVADCDKKLNKLVNERRLAIAAIGKLMGEIHDTSAEIDDWLSRRARATRT